MGERGQDWSLLRLLGCRLVWFEVRDRFPLGAVYLLGLLMTQRVCCLILLVAELGSLTLDLS